MLNKTLGLFFKLWPLFEQEKSTKPGFAHDTASE